MQEEPTTEIEFFFRVTHNLVALGETYKNMKLEGFSLHGRSLAGIIFDNCEFTDCDFSNTSLCAAEMTSCTLIDCDFTDADLDGCLLDSVNFLECKMYGTLFTNVDAEFVQFKECTGVGDFSNFTANETMFLKSCFDRSIFPGCSLDSCYFIETSLRRVYFTEESTVTDTEFKWCDITDGDFACVGGIRKEHLVFCIVSPFAASEADPFQSELAEYVPIELRITPPMGGLLGPGYSRRSREVRDRKASLFCADIEEFKSIVRS